MLKNIALKGNIYIQVCVMPSEDDRYDSGGNELFIQLRFIKQYVEVTIGQSYLLKGCTSWKTSGSRAAQLAGCMGMIGH
jgi:hypothetical protein